MSFLQDQIKDLKHKQLKADFYKTIKSKIGNIQFDNKEIEKEAKDALFAFIDSHIDMIESNEIKASAEVRNSLNEDDLSNLKLILNDADFLLKLIKRGKTINPKEPAIKADIQKPAPVTERVDKVGFALQHRTLDGKRISVDNAGPGEVVGLDAPFVVTKLDSGQTINVPIGNFKVID